MEELDITQLFNYFKSKIIYIIFATSIFFCLSSIYVNKFRVPKYTSETTILLNQANENSAINTSDINLNKSLVTTYGEIIKSKRVLNQVIEKLNLDLTYKELNSMVSVGEITDTSIISIKVTDKDNNVTSKKIYVTVSEDYTVTKSKYGQFSNLEGYNEEFKLPIVSAKNNAGNYGNSVIGNAIDGKINTHWETNSPNNSSFKNEVTFDLGEVQ